MCFWFKNVRLVAVAAVVLSVGVAPAATVLSASSSAEFRLDTREGLRESDGAETLTYSALWSGDGNSVVTISQVCATPHTTNGVLVSGLGGEGVWNWTAQYDGIYTLAHATVTGGVTDKVETAAFVVTRLGSPLVLADVTGYEGEYDGEGHGVTVSVNDPADGALVRYSVGDAPGEWSETAPFFTNACEATVWVEVSAANYVTVAQRAVVKVDKATNAWTAEPSIAGWTYGEAAGVPDLGGATFGTATVTYSAEPGNAGDYVATFTIEGTDNYDGLTNTVTFTIAPAAIVYGLEGSESVYDGEGHGVTVSVANPADGAAVRYSVGDAPGEWSETAPLFTNVCEATVWVEVSAANYTTVTNFAEVAITNRTVTLTSGSAEKVYDGTALTNHDVTVGGDGFVDGEGASYDVTGSQTHVGVGTNTFTYALNAGTHADNYAITTSNGTLTVTKATNAWTAEPSIAGWTYGEAAGVPNMGGAAFGAATVTYSAEPGDAGDYTATFTVEGTDDYDGLTFEVPFTIAPAAIESSAEGYEGVYDGEGHGIEVTVAKLDAGATVKYALAEEGPYADALLFTNATDGAVAVWYVVEAANYASATNSATVTIAPRAVTLTSGSAEKVYDGTALTCADIVVGGDGFVDGEGAAFDVTGEQMHVGTSENTFTYALNDGTLADNYEITTSNGTLTVTKATNAWTVDPSLAGWTFGDDAGVPDLGGAAFGAVTVTYSAEPGDAGSYTATFTIEGTDDYDGLTFEVPFTIAPRELGADDVEVTLGLPEGGYVGDGAAKEPAVSVTYDGHPLVEGVDYDVAYTNNVAPGTATVTVTFKGNYAGTATAEFEIAEPEPEPEPEPEVRRVLWYTDEAFSLERAATFDGYIVDTNANGAVVGTIRVKAGRPNRKTGVSRITVTIRLTGQRQITVRGTTVDGTFSALAGGEVLDLVLGRHSLSGMFGEYLVDGSCNMFAARDDDSKARSAAARSRCRGKYVVAWRASGAEDAPFNALTVEVKSRGYVSVKGTLVDGTRLRVGGRRRVMITGSRLLVGEKEYAVAVSWANSRRKVSVAFLLWFGEDGTVECENLLGGGKALVAPAGGLADGAAFRIDQEAVAAAVPGLRAELSFPGGVPAKLKLRQNAKAGTFSGSFRVYVDNGRRVRPLTVNFSGVAVDGVGYGSAFLWKPAVAWPVSVE